MNSRILQIKKKSLREHGNETEERRLPSKYDLSEKRHGRRAPLSQSFGLCSTKLLAQGLCPARSNTDMTNCICHVPNGIVSSARCVAGVHLARFSMLYFATTYPIEQDFKVFKATDVKE